MSIESVMPSNHLILCRPLLLLASIFPSIHLVAQAKHLGDAHSSTLLMSDPSMSLVQLLKAGLIPCPVSAHSIPLHQCTLWAWDTLGREIQGHAHQMWSKRDLGGLWTFTAPPAHVFLTLQARPQKASQGYHLGKGRATLDSLSRIPPDWEDPLWSWMLLPSIPSHPQWVRHPSLEHCLQDHFLVICSSPSIQDDLSKI